MANLICPKIFWYIIFPSFCMFWTLAVIKPYVVPNHRSVGGVAVAWSSIVKLMMLLYWSLRPFRANSANLANCCISMERDCALSTCLLWTSLHISLHPRPAPRTRAIVVISLTPLYVKITRNMIGRPSGLTDATGSRLKWLHQNSVPKPRT